MPLEEALEFLAQSEAARDKEIQDRERARRTRIRQRSMSVIVLLTLITVFAVWRAYDAHRSEQQIANALAIAQRASREAQLQKRIADQTLIGQLALVVPRRLASAPPGSAYPQQVQKARDASGEMQQRQDLEVRPNVANLENAIAFVHKGDGLLNSGEGDVDGAIDDYKKAIQLDRRYEQAYCQLAFAYEKKNDYDKAIANLDLAIGLNPRASYIAQRASAYERKGVYDKALADYDRIIQLLPGNTMYMVERAMAYERRGDYEKAFADYHRIVPHDSIGYLERGIGYFCAGRFAEATSDFSRALSLSSMNAYAALWLRLTRWKTGSADNAAFVQGAARVDRNAWPWPIVNLFLGNAAPDEALAAAQRRDAPDHRYICEASFYIGEYALAHQDHARAHELLSAALTKCSTTDFFVYAAAQAELKRFGN
jgi:tetratricopeptide (TPR) repeat protein